MYVIAGGKLNTFGGVGLVGFGFVFFWVRCDMSMSGEYL